MSETTKNLETNPRRAGILSILAWTIGIVILLAIGLLVIVYVGITNYGPGYVQKYISEKTGFPVKSESFKVDLLGGKAEIKNLTIDNPAEMGDGNFITVPSFIFSADLPSLFGKNYHVKDLSIYLSSITLLRQTNGTTNAQVFSERLQQAQQKQEQQKQAQARQKKTALTLDHFALKLDRVLVIDKNTGRTANLNIGLNFERNNVTDIQAMQRELVAATLSQAIRNNFASGVTNQLIDMVAGGTSNITHLPGKILKTIAPIGATQTGKGVETIQREAEQIRNIFKKPTKAPQNNNQ